jgi:serine/threonine-protein kinase
MSSVYRAWDETLERVVAIKLMNHEIATDSDQLERFRREARSVAQLSHPHIVTVIDASEDAGRPYIVFEFVEGETLKDRIRRFGELPIGEAAAYGIEIARALGAAHAGHIVHRDVKPQNVLLDREGSAKVTDFGIARSLKDEGLTADGRVLGTTDYVSPEQALGHAVTGQSDIYSLGIVLYEMLVGDVPFKGENQVAVAMKHVRDTVPDVQARRPDVSSALAAVVDRATAKELDRRYATAEDLISDLEDALAIETARAGTATGEATTVLRTLPGHARRRLPLRMRSPRLALALLALLLAAGVTAAVLLSRDAHRGTSPVAEKTPPQHHFVRLNSDAAHDYDPIGGDGEHPEATGLAVDGDPNTYWRTETYQGGLGSKAGVGLYVDARPGTAATALDVRTSSPGFAATVYGARSGPPGKLPDPGWVRLGESAAVHKRERIALSAGTTPYRFFLLWITKLPPGAGVAKVTELAILR